MSGDQETSVALGGCDAEGNRTLRLVSVVEPSSPSDQVQWYVDGQPFGPVMAPGQYEGKVPGDGEVHLLELRVLSPEGVAGDRAEIKFPLCSQNVVGHIRSIDFADRGEGGELPIRLVSQMEPEGADATVQWLLDGQPIDGPVPAGVHTSTVQVSGGVRRIELEIVEPEGAQGDIEEVEFPGPQIEARIAVAEFDWEDDYDFDDRSSEGPRDIAVDEFEDPDEAVADPAGPGDSGVDEEEEQRIAVAEFVDDDDLTAAPVGEQDERDDEEPDPDSEEEPDEDPEDGDIHVEVSEVDIEGFYLAELTLSSDQAAAWHIDGEPVGSSEPNEPLVVRLESTSVRSQAEAIVGDQTFATSFDVPQEIEFDEEAILDELMPMKEDGYRASIPDDLLQFAQQELDASDFPAETAVLVSLLEEAAPEAIEVAAQEAEEEDAEPPEPWCHNGCNDWPKIEKVGDDEKAKKTSTSKKHPLRNIVIIPCTHLKVKKRHANHPKKIFRKTIYLPCLHYYVEQQHDYDVHDVGVALSASAKLATTATSKERWLRELLPNYLKPVPGGLKKNVYFVNGIMKGWNGADGQRRYIEQFLIGVGWDVRLIHNDATDGMMTDNLQLNWDYRWANLPSSVQKNTPIRSHGSIAILSLLHFAMDSGTDLAIIGSSGGTLQTFNGIRAFSLLGSQERAYLKQHVRLLHLGCLVHRSRYSWVESTVKSYELHIDRRDPFARTFSGEVIPPFIFNPARNEGPVLSHSLMAADPVASAISNGTLSGLLPKQGTYHSIDHNYMRHDERHVKKTVFGT